MKDWISELPDDILLNVLELLPMKEAGRTSVLSKRWRHVWAYVPHLQFDPGYIDYDSMLVDDLWDFEKLKLEEDRYLDLVNQVVSLHKAPIIDEFRVQFDLDVESKASIDNWVRFAVEKRVKVLELDLEDFEGCIKPSPYKLPTFVSLCSSLTFLKLGYVDVTDEALERLIYNCQALEYLSVIGLSLLVDLKISVLNLKSLSITHCWELKNLEISAPNLISFYYMGTKLSSLPLKSTPKLAELSIGGMYGEYLMNNFLDFSSCFSQIEVLKLDLPMVLHSMEMFPICTRVKVLDVAFMPECGEDLFRFSSLIKACPLLHKFVIQLEYCPSDEIDKMEKAREREVFPHEHLKIVEIVGFAGYEIDIGFLNYLLEIGVSMEKIIIDPRHPLDINKTSYTKLLTKEEASTKKDKVRRAIDVATELGTSLKPGLHLVILEDTVF